MTMILLRLLMCVHVKGAVCFLPLWLHPECWMSSYTSLVSLQARRIVCPRRLSPADASAAASCTHGPRTGWRISELCPFSLCHNRFPAERAEKYCYVFLSPYKLNSCRFAARVGKKFKGSEKLDLYIFRLLDYWKKQEISRVKETNTAKIKSKYIYI